jgi:hypothetical protein
MATINPETDAALSAFQNDYTILKGDITPAERAFELIEIGELCYTTPDLMLQYAFVRERLFREFETFFGLLKGGATVPLDTRDEVNRLYGMLLEMRRGLEKDPRCQF